MCAVASEVEITSSKRLSKNLLDRRLESQTPWRGDNGFYALK